MAHEVDFSTELKFTETYRQHLHDHIAIREAKCLQVQYPAILTGIQDQDLLAGRLNRTQSARSVGLILGPETGLYTT